MSAFAAVEEMATQLGLVAQYSEAKGRLPRIVVSRTGDDWSMAPTTIAIGSVDIEDRAIAALRNLGPQLRRKVAEMEPGPDTQLALSAGVSSEGVVSTLRVERDGSVRLHSDDIEAIAAAVAERLGGAAGRGEGGAKAGRRRGEGSGPSGRGIR